MIESQIPAVAKFFFLTVKSPQKANEATYKTLIRLNKIYTKKPEEENNQSHFVYWTYHYWKKANTKKGTSFFSPTKKKRSEKGENLFIIPDSIDLSNWRQFLRETKEEEALFLVWSQALNISDYEIAKGIGLSDGTVRFRISHTLKKLAKILEA